MKIVIIGSVAAGTSAAAKARRNNLENEIVIYEKDSDISYSACGLPYFIGEDYINRKNLVPRNAEWFKKRFDINIKTEHEVKSIDTENKTLEVLNLLTGEKFTDRYDVLLLATGAKSVIPEIAGFDSKNVFSLRNIKNGESIKKYITENSPKSAVIIGSGFIGIEMAENLVKRGIKVSIIEEKNQVMPSVDIEMAEYVEKELIKNVIAVYKNESAEKIENKKVITSRGKVIEADMVILAVGVKPETELAKQVGVELGVSGAIKVDKEMRTNIKDIFAAGDCAESFNLIDRRSFYRPLGSTANKMGRIAGDVITGMNLEFRGILGTGIVRCFDLTIAHTGYTEKEAVRFGYDIEVIHNIKPNQTEYFEGSSEMVIKGIADRATGRLIGVQIVGKKGVDKRIDVFATAMTFGAKAEDLFHIDLAYAPPYSTAKDPVMYTGMILENALKKERKVVTPLELMEKREEFTIIDVRAEEDYENGHIDGAINIPLDKLQEKSKEIDKKIKIAVHCNKGVTGNAAQNLLINLGFKEVYNISGGYKGYKNEEKMKK